MIKIKTIDYIKVVYDESLSQNIFSIANITFSNREPINGALLYWQRNKDDAEYTAHGDYKFFYDMANVQYFASVKFPKYTNLTKEEKQELAYILLEERGAVGSYSFSTNRTSKYAVNFKKTFAALTFPENFDPTFCPLYIKSELAQMDVNFIQHQFPTYEESFIRAYAAWRHTAAYLHPEQLKPYMNYIDINYIVATNKYVADLFLIEHLQKIDLELLPSNVYAVTKLSGAFQAYILEHLDTEAASTLRELLAVHLNDEDASKQMQDEVVLEYFAYDRGASKWPGSEHLVKGIPSLYSVQYDAAGYKRRTNKEMDTLTDTFNTIQWQLFSACAEPHWLNRYRANIDWSTASMYNAYLTEDFIIAMQNCIDFVALGQNVQLRLSEAFLTKYMKKFNHQKPQPLIIRNLTEKLYDEHRTMLKISYDALMEYSHLIEEPRLQSLINLLD